MKNWQIKVLSTALAMSVLVPTASFAADTLTNNDEGQNGKIFVHQKQFDQEKHQQMQEQLLDSVTKYTPEDLAQWKTALNEQEQLMTALREKVKAVHEDLKNGDITKEQATEQLKELGIKRLAIPDGVNKPEIPQADKEKLEAIREQVRAGELTPEQAKAEMEKLGFKAKGLKVKEFGGDNLKMQFDQAVKAKDQSEVKALLPQMLQQLQERNRQMAERLADTNE